MHLLQHMADEDVDIQRLGDRGGHARGDAALVLFLQRVRRLADDGQRRREPAQAARGLESVHFRHLHVHQHEVVAVPAPLDRLDREAAVADQFDFRAFPAQEILQHQRIDLVVLGGKDAQAGEPRASGPHREPVARHGTRALAQRQAQLEGAAHAGFAVHAETATHQLGQAPADGEPQARAAVLAGRAAIGLLERAEQALQVRRRDADAAVGDTEDEFVALAARAEANLASGRELHRVGQQVQEDLRDPHRVAEAGRRQIVRLLDFEPQVPGGRAVAQHPGGLLDELRRVERHRLDLELARLDLREIEDVVDDRQQQLARVEDASEGLPRLLAARAVPVADLRETEHAVQWRADFVRHVREEFALDARELLGGLPRLFACLIGALPLGDVEEAQHGARHARLGQDRVGGGGHRHRVAVAMPEGVVQQLALASLAHGGEQRAALRRVRPAVVDTVVDRRMDVASEQFPGGEAQQLGDGGIDHADDAVGVEFDDAFGQRFHHEPQALLGGREFRRAPGDEFLELVAMQLEFLRELALAGDVLLHGDEIRDVAVLVAHGRDAAVIDADRAARAAIAQFPFPRATLQQGRAEIVEGRRRAGIGAEHPRRLANGLLARITGDPAERVVDEGDPA